MASNFILRNSVYSCYLLTIQDFSVEGLPISHAFENAENVHSIEDYCEKIVMKMGEDARDFIINLTPLVLRVSLEVVYIAEPN